jgi:hypothetical protein
LNCWEMKGSFSMSRYMLKISMGKQCERNHFESLIF